MGFILFSLPDDIVIGMLTDWWTWRDIVKLDKSLVNSDQRNRYLSLPWQHSIVMRSMPGKNACKENDQCFAACGDKASNALSWLFKRHFLVKELETDPNASPSFFSFDALRIYGTITSLKVMPVMMSKDDLSVIRPTKTDIDAWLKCCINLTKVDIQTVKFDIRSSFSHTYMHTRTKLVSVSLLKSLNAGELKILECNLPNLQALRLSQDYKNATSFAGLLSGLLVNDLLGLVTAMPYLAILECDYVCPSPSESFDQHAVVLARRRFLNLHTLKVPVALGAAYQFVSLCTNEKLKTLATTSDNLVDFLCPRRHLVTQVQEILLIHPQIDYSFYGKEGMISAIKANIKGQGQGAAEGPCLAVPSTNTSSLGHKHCLEVGSATIQVINASWHRKWKAFIQQDLLPENHWTIESLNDYYPGSVDNSTIIDPSFRREIFVTPATVMHPAIPQVPPQLKSGLQEGVDYILTTANKGRMIKELYGIDHTIERSKGHLPTAYFQQPAPAPSQRQHRSFYGCVGSNSEEMKCNDDNGDCNNSNSNNSIGVQATGRSRNLSIDGNNSSLASHSPNQQQQPQQQQQQQPQVIPYIDLYKICLDMYIVSYHDRGHRHPATDNKNQYWYKRKVLSPVSSTPLYNVAKIFLLEHPTLGRCSFDHCRIWIRFPCDDRWMMRGRQPPEENLAEQETGAPSSHGTLITENVSQRLSYDGWAILANKGQELRPLPQPEDGTTGITSTTRIHVTDRNRRLIDYLHRNGQWQQPWSLDTAYVELLIEPLYWNVLRCFKGNMHYHPCMEDTKHCPSLSIPASGGSYRGERKHYWKERLQVGDCVDLWVNGGLVVTKTMMQEEAEDQVDDDNTLVSRFHSSSNDQETVASASKQQLMKTTPTTRSTTMIAAVVGKKKIFRPACVIAMDERKITFQLFASATQGPRSTESVTLCKAKRSAFFTWQYYIKPLYSRTKEEEWVTM